MKFISIGSNCACLGFLGKDRIRGPVDNVLLDRGMLSCEYLFNGKFLSLLLLSPQVKDCNKTFKTDIGKSFTYNNTFTFVHNDPTTDKFKIEIEKRYNNLIKADNSTLYTYSLGLYDCDKKTHTLKYGFYEGIDFLNSLGKLKNTIIVATQLKNNTGNWDYYSEDIEKFCNKKHIKFVNIIDDNIYYPDKTYSQFIEKVERL